MDIIRTERTDIKELLTARQTIALGPNQCFYETPKAYEIWDTEPLLRLVHRISKKRVLWVLQK